MYTMAAIMQGDRTFLLQNFATAAAGEWCHYNAGAGALSYFALTTGAEGQVDAGLNSSGLALLSGVAAGDSAALCAVFAQVLSQCRDVKTAIDRVVECISAQADPLLRGHVALGTSECIAVLEYGGGHVEHEVITHGFVAKSDCCQLEIVDGAGQKNEPSYGRMVEFAEGLYAWLPTLDGEDVVERCRAVLRQEPLCDESTSSSAVIEVGDGRVDYLLGSGRWQTSWLADALS